MTDTVWIAADSSRNSAALSALRESVDTAPGFPAKEAEFQEVFFVEPIDLPYCLQTERPSKPSSFGTNILLRSSSQVSVLANWKDSADILFCQMPTARLSLRHVPIRYPVTQGPSRDSWTVSSRTVIPSIASGFNEPIADLKAIVDSIQRREILRRSPTLRDLARRVKVTTSLQEDKIEEWASRLAQDVVDADD